MHTHRPWWIWLLAVLLITLGLMKANRALAQQQTIYDRNGRVVGHSTTDTQGTRTLYGPNGSPVIRQSGDVFYDAKTGNRAGSVSEPKPKR